MALHASRGTRWAEAVPVLEQVVAEMPVRLPAVEGLARVRERQGRAEEAVALWQQVGASRDLTAAELAHLGDLSMALGRTPDAIAAFEAARQQPGSGVARDLELGLLYLDARRVEDARAALDRVPSSHPDYAMAAFKRAQVSVLLKEPDAAVRIAEARRRASPETRALIESERLFR
jgi:tetratricopeptide (TPR) repeat protein